MKEFTYPIFGICPNRIRVRINEEDMTFDSVLFAGGCPGNHEGINALCHGMKIEDVIKKIGEFYLQTQKSHVSVAVHYDLGKINVCKKNASSILSAIKNAQKIIGTQDSVEALIRMSKDPILGMQQFVELLKLVSADVRKADLEVAQRLSNKGTASGEKATNQFLVERERLALCRATIEEVKKNHVIG